MPPTILSSQGGYADRNDSKRINAKFNEFLRLAILELDQAPDTRGDGGLGLDAMFFDLDMYLRLIKEIPEAFGLTDVYGRFIFKTGNEKLDPGKMGFL